MYKIKITVVYALTFVAVTVCLFLTTPDALAKATQSNQAVCDNFKSRYDYYSKQVESYDNQAKNAATPARRNSYLKRKNDYINDQTRVRALARSKGCNLSGSSDSSDSSGYTGLASSTPSSAVSTRTTVSTTSRASGGSRCSVYQNRIADYDRRIADYDKRARTATTERSRDYSIRTRDGYIRNKQNFIGIARNNGCNVSGNPDPVSVTPSSSVSTTRVTRTTSTGRYDREPAPTLESSTPRISPPLSTGRSQTTPPPSVSSSRAGGDGSKCTNINSRLAYYDRQITDYDAKAGAATSARQRNSYLERKNTYNNDKNRMMGIARSAGCR